MPITKSAIKAMKQSRKANDRNKSVKADFRIKTKAAKKDASDGAKELGKLTSLAIQSLDKAAKNGVIHKKTAARKKSRMVKALTKLSGKVVELVSVKEAPKTKTPVRAKTTTKPKTTAKKTTEKEA